MEVDVKREIVAIVTLATQEQVASGVPTFFAKDDEERDRLASSLAPILRAAIHDLGNGTFILVKH